MENKNLLGHIYGSRKSKAGTYLNLIIAVDMNGEKKFITCPIRLNVIDGQDKPTAFIDETGKAYINTIPVYEEPKPKQPDALEGDLPF